MIWKNKCLAVFRMWRWNVPSEKIIIQFKDRRKFRFFLKPEVSSFTHAQLIWERGRERARKNLGWKQQFVRWFLLVGGFSGQLTIWWRQSPEVTFHFPSNARKIHPWALKDPQLLYRLYVLNIRKHVPSEKQAFFWAHFYRTFISIHTSCSHECTQVFRNIIFLGLILFAEWTELYFCSFCYQ